MNDTKIFTNINNNEDYILTPPINNFNKITLSFSNWHHQIKRIVSNIKNGKKINKNDYQYIDYLFESSSPFATKIEANLIKPIISAIDNDYSIHYFNDKIVANIPPEYVYKISGVPCQKFNKQQLVDALLGKEEINNNLFALAILDFCEKNQYFSTEFCLPEIKNTLLKLENKKSELLIFQERYIKEEDERKVQTIQNQAQQPLKKVVNEEFKNMIFNSIPKEYSLLEKSIYIYVRLCQFLTYDQAYYVNSKDNFEHTYIDKLKEIVPQNNKIVCYEFTYILFELLTELGLEVSPNMPIIENEFIEQHANLKYVTDNMAIFADSTTSVLEGDLIRIKIGEKIDGLRCTNYSKECHQKFDAAVKKVYDDIKTKTLAEDIYQTKKEYQELEDNKKLEMKDKVQYIFHKIDKKQLDPIDAIAYLGFLKNIVFSQEEQKNNFYNTVVFSPLDNTPRVILSINASHFNYSSPNNAYFIWNPNTGTITQTTIEEINKNFKENTISFIEHDNTYIPGRK